jgi:hypothetical protein
MRLAGQDESEGSESVKFQFEQPVRMVEGLWNPSQWGRRYSGEHPASFSHAA